MGETSPQRKTTTTGSSGGGRFIAPTVEEIEAVLSNYDFVEIIGQGGMGAVYKARQPNLDRLVAIKLLPGDVEEIDQLFVERFKREAKAMAKLSHSNIVAVYDFGVTTDSQFYIVMEFVAGTDLSRLIKSREVSLENVLNWMPQICSALQYAHAKGLIHRDIKPANILIDPDGQVKVVDFGLAKFTGDQSQTKLTRTNVAMGSPDYFAPECLHDDLELDWRADIFSVGVLLYELLTGSVPRGAWQPPSAVNPKVDDRFDDLVVAAMDPNRETRIQQVSEIADAIAEFRDNPALEASGRQINLLTGPVPIRKASRHTTAVAPGSGGRPKVRLHTGPVQPKKDSGQLPAEAPASQDEALQVLHAQTGPVRARPTTGSPLKVFIYVSASIAALGGILFYFFGQ